MMGVKKDRRRPVLKLVEKRSRHHLLPLIRQHVKQGSTIISDQWRTYRNVLGNMGYVHYTVNHSQYFVDPQSGSHTQHLKRAWLSFKEHIWRQRGNRNEALLKEHLAVIEWSYWAGNKHPKGLLGQLFKDIFHAYPL